MNKRELISLMAEKSNLNKAIAEKALNALIEAIQDTVSNGEDIQLVGFGTFGIKERAARVCMNPKTKEKINVPATKVPSFKAGKDFKEKINK